LVIGCGNELRGDDAAGLRVAESVERLCLPGVRVLTCYQLTPELAEAVADARATVFVDASVRGQPGAVETGPVALASSAAPMDHTMSPGALLALSEAVFGRRSIAFLVSISVAECGMGLGLTPEAELGVASATKSLVQLLSML